MPGTFGPRLNGGAPHVSDLTRATDAGSPYRHCLAAEPRPGAGADARLRTSSAHSSTRTSRRGKRRRTTTPAVIQPELSVASSKFPHGLTWADTSQSRRNFEATHEGDQT